MGGFLRTLAKIGLVELDSEEAGEATATVDEMSADEARRIIREAAAVPTTGGPAAGRSSPPTSAVPSAHQREQGAQARTAASGPNAGSTSLVPGPDGGLADDLDPDDLLVTAPTSTTIEEGRPLEALYDEAGIRPSPFPAEKLLRLLDGLMAMDPVTRKTAIKAMDAADDAWTIEDPILDAERKIAVLEAQKGRINGLVQEAEGEAESALAAQAEYQARATEEIRRQIADLEALLQQELEKVAKERAEVTARLQATRQAAQREKKRIDGEVARLGQIGALFSPASQPEPENPGST